MYLKDLRLNKKEIDKTITQEKLAETLDVSVDTVQLWERTDKISKSNLEKLVKFFDLNQKECDELVLNLNRIDVGAINCPICNSKYAMDFIQNIKEPTTTTIIFDTNKEFRNLFNNDKLDIVFYSLMSDFCPLTFNPFMVPQNIEPQIWIDNLIQIFTDNFHLTLLEKALLSDTIYELYEETSVFKACGKPDWRESTEIKEASSKINFASIYQRMYEKKIELKNPNAKGKYIGNDTTDAYTILLGYLASFARDYSYEYKLYGHNDVFSIDDVIYINKIHIFEIPKNYNNSFIDIIKDIIVFYQSLQNTTNYVFDNCLNSNYTQYRNIICNHIHLFLPSESFIPDNEIISSYESQYLYKIEQITQDYENLINLKVNKINDSKKEDWCISIDCYNLYTEASSYYKSLLNSLYSESTIKFIKNKENYYADLAKEMNLTKEMIDIAKFIYPNTKLPIKQNKTLDLKELDSILLKRMIYLGFIGQEEKYFYDDIHDENYSFTSFHLTNKGDKLIQYLLQSE